MKYKFVLPLFCATMLMACEDSNLIDDAGILAENMDAKVLPGNDFYEYTCGGWMKSHPLPDEYSRYCTFDVLEENNTKQMRDIIQELSGTKHSEGSLEQKIGDLYNIVMDSIKQNQEGCAPIMPMWNEIKAIQTREEIFPLMMKNYISGVGALFGCGFDADLTNSSKTILKFVQSGLKMGNRDYYLDDDANTVKIREAYKRYIVNLFTLCGVDEATAKAKMEVIMRLETRMAEKSYSPTQLRDVEKNFNKMSIDKFYADYKGVDWKKAFNAVGLTALTELSVNQIEPIQEAVAILQQEPVEDLKTYMEWSLLNSSATCLGDKFYDESFQFFGKTLNGQNAKRPRWKIAFSAVEGMMGQGLGKLYVEKHFPAAAKERMEKMVKNLQTALAERIQAQDWMSEATKQVALDKLNAFYVKVGYPNKWTDYSSLTITNDSYWNNVVRASIFDWNDMLARMMNQPIDRDDWHMNPQEVNAYYNCNTNEITFPAGILQYPFFDMNADDAFNYGAIGVVIGHEMTHGFDDQGRQFDKDGNFRNWWQEDDAKRFDERAEQLITFFNNIKVLPDLNANGALTIGENLADHGGIMVAYQAFKNATKDQAPVEKKGYTPDQRFFIAYAGLWANNIREEGIRQRTKTDPHSLGRWRVNGTLPHIDAWYKAFNITPADSLYLPEDQRVKIW